MPCLYLYKKRTPTSSQLDQPSQRAFTTMAKNEQGAYEKRPRSIDPAAPQQATGSVRPCLSDASVPSSGGRTASLSCTLEQTVCRRESQWVTGHKSKCPLTSQFPGPAEKRGRRAIPSSDSHGTCATRSKTPHRSAPTPWAMVDGAWLPPTLMS